MDNSGVLALNINEYYLLENLRDSRGINPRPEPAAPREQQVDVVEFSRQALQLSRAVENPPEVRINPATGAEAAALEQERQQFQAGIPEVSANGIPGVNEDVYPVNGSQQTGAGEEQINVAPGLTPGTEAAAAPDLATLVTPDVPLATETPAAPATTDEYLMDRLNTAVTDTLQSYVSSVPSTAEGMVIRETEISLTPENRGETERLAAAAAMEEANLLTRTNDILANGNPAATGAGAAWATEIAQYQEQVLLQAVGTQLAQAVPPSSIFSLLV